MTMIRFGAVLCPVDLSDTSRLALRYAFAVAARFGARVNVCVVDEPLLAAASALHFDPAAVEAKTRAELDAFVGATAPAGAAVAVARRTGEPYEEILSCAGDLGADLIVIGTHGLGGYRKLLLGSTTERVLRYTTIPVLAIPPTASSIDADSGGRPAVAVREVLAPIDLEAHSDADAQRASAVALAFDARVVLLHVVADAFWTDQPAAARRAARQARHVEALAALERIGNALGAGVESLVTDGNPADEIASTATSRDAGLIVMSLQGAPRLPPRQPGVIAYRVLRQTATPVLAFPVDRPG